jgi:hypothetical protein
MVGERRAVHYTVGMRDGPDDTGGIADERPSIRAVQEALRAVAAIPVNEVFRVGEFDKITAKGARRFQWYLSNVPGFYNVQTGYGARELEPDMTIDGNAGPRTIAALASFVSLRRQVTGFLVKFNFSNYPRISANSGFRALIAGQADVGLCDRSFAGAVAGMNTEATTQGIYVYVNQMFRVEGAVVAGAVVPPAGSSAHKIGRAIDLQLGEQNGRPQLSAAIRTAKADTPFGRFRDNVKLAGSRYGGDFQQVDAPHFDRQLFPAGGKEWKSIFYVNQLQYQQALENVLAVPDYVGN